MAGDKYLSINSTGENQEKTAVQSSAGVADAGKIPALDNTGFLDESLLPVGGLNYQGSLSSGIITGGEVTINADPTKIDISAGTGVIVDSWTNPSAPVTYNISWGAYTAVPVTYLASADSSYVMIDNAGAVYQQVGEPDSVIRRDYITLALLGHTSRTAVASVNKIPQTFASPIQQMRDMFHFIGLVNEGNMISANGANLKLNRSAGAIFAEGSNFYTNNASPNEVDFASGTAITFRRRTQTGAGASGVDTLDVGNYDVGGTITALSGTKYTNQRVFMFSNGNVVVQYGQSQYNSMAAAVSGLSTESFVEFPSVLEAAILIGIISISSNATDLTNSNQAIFTSVSKFGEIGSGTGGLSTTTLQQAYNNSSDPEILTDSTRGAFTVRRGSAADTDTIYEGQNGAGTNTFSVTGNGLINSATLTASTILSANASKNIISLSTATYPSLTELSYVKGVTSTIQSQITPTTDSQRIINARANKTGFVLGQSAVAASVTGTLTETTLATISVPAAFLGLNGSIDIITLWSNNNTGTAKTFRGRWNGIGGNAFLGVSSTTNVAYSDFRRIANRNSASSQIFFNRVSISSGGWGFGTSASPTDTVNTANAVDIVLTGQLADVGDTVTLQEYIIIGYPT